MRWFGYNLKTVRAHQIYFSTDHHYRPMMLVMHVHLKVFTLAKVQQFTVPQLQKMVVQSQQIFAPSKCSESLRSEQSVAVDVSMLQGAALETPASLDPATLQPEPVSDYSNQREEHEEDISSHGTTKVVPVRGHQET